MYSQNREKLSFKTDTQTQTHRLTARDKKDTKVHLLSCAFAANNQTDLQKELHLGSIVDFLKILDKFEFKCRFVKIECRFVKIRGGFVKFKSRFVELSRWG